jgi:hypothetical protein
LAETNILREFLSRNHISLPKSFEILYRENTNTWQRSFHYDTSSENWLIVFEWSCCDDYDPGNYSWKYHLHVRKQRGAVIQNTRVMINFASHGMLDKDEMFSVSFNVNASTKRVTSRQPIIVKYKIMTDEIGLFRKDPYLVTTISVLEKG